VNRGREIKDGDIQKVIALWKICGLTRPWNDPVTDINFARRGPASAVLVWEDLGHIIATVMVGHDGHRGAMYYLGVDPAHRKSGLGSEVIRVAEAWFAERGVWKVNILVRSDNAEARGFYEKLGFTSHHVISLGKIIRR
jgi:ribosomal protein S18 acetylase RimI-like enzyme